FISFILIIILWKKNSNLIGDIDYLDSKIQKLELDIKNIKLSQIQKPVEFEKQEIKIVETVEDSKLVTEQLKSPAKIINEEVPNSEKIESTEFKEEISVQLNPQIEVPNKQTTQQIKKKSFIKDNFEKVWKKIEKPLVENWTGILGALILVMGAGFLGIYAAFIVSPFLRFLMIVGLSGFVYWVSFYLHKKTDWREITQYLKSTSAAIFLIACVGSFGIQALTWIENIYLSIVFLSLGVIANLFIGLNSGKQSFLSLHTILSLVSLVFLENTFHSLLLGSLVVIVVISKNFSEKWDWHLLSTLVSYFIFSIINLSKDSYIYDSVYFRYTIILFTLINYSGFLIIHYKNVLYERNKLETLPLLSHLLSWSFLGLILLKLSSGNYLTSLLLILASAALFLFSKLAKQKEISWLFYSDKIISLILGFLFAYSLNKFGVSFFLILLLCGVQSLVFTYLVIKENSLKLTYVGLGSSSIISLFIFVTVLLNSNSDLDNSTIINLSSYLFFILLSNFLFPFFRSKRLGEIFEKKIFYFFPGIFGVISGVSVYAAYPHLIGIKYINLLVLGILSILLIHYNKRQGLSLGTGIVLAITLIYSKNWEFTYTQLTKTGSREDYLIYNLPLLILPVVLVFNSFSDYLQRKLSFIGIIFFVIHSAQFAIIFGSKIEVYIPGILLLCITIVLLELSKFTERFSEENLKFYYYPNDFIKLGSFTILITFIFRNFVYEDIVSYKLFTIPYAYITKGLGILTSAFFILRLKNSKDKFFQKYFSPFLYEIILIITVFATGYFTGSWGLFVFSILPLLMLYFGKTFKEIDRFRLYSFLFFIFSGMVILSFTS
ncbi:MAG: hypothetical protein KDK36_19655, partial [Leptospiraceae bacterium]|nr:hypothetical protein [Leptospiraceae bacterium]